MPRITNAQYRAAAERIHGSEGSVEIDDGAKVSRGDDAGAYVQAWVWVSDEDAKPSDEEGADHV